MSDHKHPTYVYLLAYTNPQTEEDEVAKGVFLSLDGAKQAAQAEAIGMEEELGTGIDPTLIWSHEGEDHWATTAKGDEMDWYCVTRFTLED